MIPAYYNIRSLVVRRSTTLAAVIGIGLVVFVLSAVLMLSNGLRETLKHAGEKDNVLILRKGSQAEMQSGFDEAQAALVRSAEEVLPRGTGTDSTAELVVLITLPKKNDSIANVTVRGVTEDSFSFRPSIRILQGRKARAGTDEVMVGRAIAGKVKNLAIGETLTLKKNRVVQVVGIFESAGSSFESEIWADLGVTRALFGRASQVSSVSLKLKDPQLFESFRKRLDADPRLGLEAKRETTYYEEQSQGLSMFIQTLGIIISVFFSIGAMIGAMITMYAQVAERKKEIGTLRAIGFRRSKILVSFLLESMLLSFFGGIIGCIAAFFLGMIEISTTNFLSFSEVAFRFIPSPTIFVVSLLFSMGMGVFGGLFPALQAARIPAVQAMKGA